MVTPAIYKSFVKKAGFVFLMGILLLSFPGRAQEKKFIATTAAPEIGIDDKTEVTYEFFVKATKLIPPKFNDLKIVSGPLQSEKKQTTVVGGQSIETTSTSLTYTLKPLKTGKLVILPARLITEGGDTIVSNSLQINVTKTGTGNTLITKLDIENVDLILALSAAKDHQYIVAAGPVHGSTDDPFSTSDKTHADQVLKNIIAAIQKTANTKYIGTYYWENISSDVIKYSPDYAKLRRELPRAVFAIADTNGVRSAIERFYQSDKVSRYITTIAPNQPLALFQTINDLRSIHRLYADINSSLKLTKEHQTGTTKPKNIGLQLIFNNEQWQKFVDRATEMGCVTTLKPATRQNTHHIVEVYKTAIPSKATIEKICAELFETALQYQGIYQAVLIKKI